MSELDFSIMAFGFCALLIFDVRKRVIYEAKYRDSQWTAFKLLMGLPQRSRQVYTPPAARAHVGNYTLCLAHYSSVTGVRLRDLSVSPSSANNLLSGSSADLIAYQNGQRIPATEW